MYMKLMMCKQKFMTSGVLIQYQEYCSLRYDAKSFGRFQIPQNHNVDKNILSLWNVYLP
jgi:hypothetical protein